MKLLTSDKIAEKKLLDIKNKISKLKIKPKLVVISTGSNPASEIYISKKQETCNNVGIIFEHKNFKETTTNKLISYINKMNNDKSVSGILVQLPLLSNLDKRAILESVNPKKDVDAFCSTNKGLLDTEIPKLVPCTANAVVDLLEGNKISIKGKHVVVVGTSEVVGMPLSKLLLHKGATVTMCNINTLKLEEKTKRGDIVISATGQPNLIKTKHIKKGAVVINVGLSKNKDKIIGDVDFDNVCKIASFITTTTKSVGPLTIANLLQNVLICHNL